MKLVIDLFDFKYSNIGSNINKAYYDIDSFEHNVKIDNGVVQIRHLKGDVKTVIIPLRNISMMEVVDVEKKEEVTIRGAIDIFKDNFRESYNENKITESEKNQYKNPMRRP